MKRILSIVMIFSILNMTVYPYILMAQTAPKRIVERQETTAKAPGRVIPIPSRSVAISRSAKGVRVLWNKEAFTGATHLEIVRSPAFSDGNKIIRVDKASYTDTDVTDSTEYKYTVSMVDNKGNKTGVKTMNAWFGAREGKVLAGSRSRIEYEGFNLAFKGTEFKKDKKVKVRISPNTLKEDSLIQASDLYEITLEDSEQPEVPVTAEISYNTINMPKGYSEKDLRVFVRHDAQSSWEFAKIISIDKENKIIYAAIPHFSEIMAGFVGAPEESQTRGNVNTALPKIALQDPLGGKMKIPSAQPGFSGALSQSIPIVLPVGKAGMTPDVSLVYNSDQKNGLCGYGWGLSAGDSISYVKKNGAYVYTCSAGELTNISSGVYRLKYENSFARYEYDSGPDLWKVIKDGYTNYYGEDTNSRLTNNLPGNPTKQWLLTRKASPDSVIIQYNYARTSGGELVLDNITYDHFKVQMDWNDRPDKFNYTSAFGYYTMKEELAGIHLSNTLTGPYQLDRKYVLKYMTNDAGDSLLTNIELLYSDETSLSQVGMTYKTNAFEQSVTNGSQTWGGSALAEDRQHFLTMDINGDGLQDIVAAMDGLTNASYGKFKIYTNSAQGFAQMASLWNITDSTNINDLPMERINFRDMNGDGLPDIIANFTAYGDSTQATWKVFTNSGSGFAYCSNYTLTADVDFSLFSVTDMNGDGKPDFVLNKTGISGTGIVLEAYTNSGTGIVSSSAINWQHTTATDPQFAGLKDLTGDGLSDLVIREDSDISNIWKVFRNTNGGFDGTYYTYNIPKTDLQFIEWMDINGDGMQELTVQTNIDTNGFLSVYRNNGTSLSNIAESWSVPVTDPYGMSFQDMNGDGRPDVVVNYQDTNIKVDVWLNTGTNFVYKGTVDLQGTEPYSESFTDINGDGAADSVINNDDGTITVYKGKQNFNYLLDTLEANYAVVSYEYDNVNAGLGFTKTVLKQTTVKNGLANDDPERFSKDTYYTYEQGKYDRTNHIMYGFGKITVSDVLGNKSVAYYDQSGEERIGCVLTNETYVGVSPKLISRSVNNYTNQFVHNDRSKIVLLTDTVDCAISLDRMNTNFTKMEYKYYGMDTNTSAAADTNYLLWQKISRQRVAGAPDGENYTNVISADDVYQEYTYTTASVNGNITPKLRSSESYMIKADDSKDKLGETRYYFVGAADEQNIGTSARVAMKKEWNGSTSSPTVADKWLVSVNRYDAADEWMLTGMTLYSETNGYSNLIRTAAYGYDGTKRFVTGTTNTYGISTPVVETSQSEFELVWGLPLKVIDNNNQTNYYRYDIGNRLVATYAPGDNFDPSVAQTGLSSVDSASFRQNSDDSASTLYIYGTSGNTTYTEALKRMKRNDISDNAFIESIAFLDGLGTTLQTRVSHKNTSGNKYYAVSGKVLRDQLGRVTESNDPFGITESLTTYYAYDTNSNNPVTNVYDDLGRVIATSKGSGANQITVSNLYIGLYTNVSFDGNGNIHDTVKDEYGRVKTVADYVTNIRQTSYVYSTIDYKYDLRGNLTNTTDISNNVISMAYDQLNRKTNMNDPDMGIWSYEYDDLGRQTKTTDAKGQVSQNAYDAAGRLISKSFEGSEAPAVTYEYGTNSLLYNNGRLISVDNTASAEEYTYNERGEVTNSVRTIDSTSYISASTFDALGRIETLVYPHTNNTVAADIIMVKYTYQNYSGLLDKIEQIDVTTEAVTRTYLSAIDYDAMGRRTAVTYGNNVKTEYSYDNVKSMLSNCTITSASLVVIKDVDYTFDKVGNLLQKNDETESITEYKYDSLNRLIYTKHSSSATTGFTAANTYDALGNVRTKDVDTSATPSTPGNRNYQYGSTGSPTGAGPHAVTSMVGIYSNDTSALYSFMYDLNGNMTNQTITYAENGTNMTNVKAFTWDGENRLTALSWKGTNWSYSYDSTGERVKKSSSAGGTTTYVSGMAQFGSSSEIYSVMDGVNHIASIRKDSSTNNVYYQSSDHVGTMTIITTEDGEIYKKVVYRSFGELWSAWKDGDGWDPPNSDTLSEIGNFAFTGQEYDFDTGLYYYGARYYDPNIGRFISADTIVPDPFDTQNYGRYTYCKNNPIVYSDPTGHSDDWWGNFWKGAASVVATVVVSVWGLANYIGTANDTKKSDKTGWLAYVWWQDDKISIGGVFFGNSGGNAALSGSYDWKTGKLVINGEVSYPIGSPSSGGGSSSSSSSSSSSGDGSNSGNNNNTPPSDPATSTPGMYADGSVAGNAPKTEIPTTVMDPAVSAAAYAVQQNQGFADRTYAPDVNSRGGWPQAANQSDLSVNSVVTRNYDGGGRKGMEGYEVIQYRDADGQNVSLLVNNVKWGEDSIIESGQNGRNYEHPTNPGEYSLSLTEPTSKGYSIYINSPKEAGNYVHYGYVSEGCPVLGRRLDPSASAIMNSLENRLQSGYNLHINMSVNDTRSIFDKLSRPLPY